MVRINFIEFSWIDSGRRFVEIRLLLDRGISMSHYFTKSSEVGPTLYLAFPAITETLIRWPGKRHVPSFPGMNSSQTTRRWWRSRRAVGADYVHQTNWHRIHVESWDKLCCHWRWTDNVLPTQHKYPSDSLSRRKSVLVWFTLSRYGGTDSKCNTMRHIFLNKLMNQVLVVAHYFVYR